jgi:hypothetical protein
MLPINLLLRLNNWIDSICFDNRVFRNWVRNEKPYSILYRKCNESLWMSGCWASWTRRLFIIPCNKLKFSIVKLFYRFLQGTAVPICLAVEVFEVPCFWFRIIVSKATATNFWRDFKNGPPFSRLSLVV